MIIKEKDPVNSSLEQLEGITKLSDLPKETLLKAEKELKLLKSGHQGEKDSAYFIEFYYKNSSNWAIIHDLRIDYGGFIAQIDHLLINRFLDFYVLESKNYARGIKVTEHGEFLVSFQKSYLAIESPIEQNKRHIKVLRSLLQGEEILPKRLGLSLRPNFLPYILVSPKSRVIRPNAKDFDTKMIIKSDEFYKQTQDNLDNEGILATVGSMARVISQTSLKEIAEKLAKYHKPIRVDYYDKYGIAQTQTLTEISNPSLGESEDKQELKENSKYFCCSCKKYISKKVATFCFSHKTRFNGKAYCYDCQKQFSAKSSL